MRETDEGQVESTVTAGISRSLEGCFNHFITDDVDDDEGLVSKVNVFALLEQIELDRLEELLLAVQGRGEVFSCCIRVPKVFRRLPEDVQSPHLVCCHLWRWPNVGTNQLVLRSVPFCTFLYTTRNNCGHGTSVDEDVDGFTCCNPHHWSRIASSG